MVGYLHGDPSTTGRLTSFRRHSSWAVITDAFLIQLWWETAKLMVQCPRVGYYTGYVAHPFPSQGKYIYMEV